MNDETNTIKIEASAKNQTVSNRNLNFNTNESFFTSLKDNPYFR